MRSLARALLVSAAGLAFAPVASAQEVDTAGAQALFDQARALVNAGDYAHACPKFAASQKKDPAAGTLLNLANCYEKNGQTATAWATFKEAAAAARTAHHPDWEKRANERITALQASLSHLTVHLDPANDASKTTVTRDGFQLQQAELGVAIPVDPGSHAIDADAPGKKHFHADVTVAAGASVDANVVALDDGAAVTTAGAAATAGVATAPSAPPFAPASTDGTHGSSSQRTVGILVGAVGVVGLAVGAVTGLSAVSKNNSASSACPNAANCASRSAIDDESSAKSLGNVSTAFFVGGGVLVAGGALLYVLSPRDSAPTSPASAANETKLRAYPLLGAGSGGFALQGAF